MAASEEENCGELWPRVEREGTVLKETLKHSPMWERRPEIHEIH